MSKKKKQRPSKYEKKIQVKEDVTFEDILKVAVSHDPKSKKKKE